MSQNNNNNRRRSLSMSSTPHVSQSESTSLYSKSKHTFLSRFKQPSNIPVKSVSAVPYHHRKPVPSSSTLPGRKKFEAVLGVKAEDIFSENVSKKNVSNNNNKFGSLFRKKRSKSVVVAVEEEEKDHIYVVEERLVSARKSTGSFSIYSTFGPESIDEEELEEEDSDDDDEDDDVVEQFDTTTETKLSKRLSGGHYGSAGGLLLTIQGPQDVAKSMIDWKRRSDQSLVDVPEQQSNTPIRYAAPTRPLPPHPETDNEDPKECATRLWHEDDSFVQREQIAEWLGQSKPLNTETLHEYMLFFDFSKLRLDSAFRKVCSKLYFRAEAQQIDRILEAFAKRYWQCNPRSIFGSADIIYAVVYSLLLLNTDLHVAQGTYTRMTRQEFVRNTMLTVRDQKSIELKSKPKSENYMIAWESHVESYLKDMYISVKNNQILQPTQHQSVDYESSSISSGSTKRMSMMAGKRMIRSMMHKSGSTRESMLFLDDASSLPRKSTSSSANWLVTPRESFTSHRSVPTPKSTTSSAVNSSTYMREGIVMRKHLLESKNQKAKHREWRECLLVVRQGEFKMYGLPYENYGETPSKLHMLKGASSLANLSDSLQSPTSSNKWAAYTQLIGTVDLQHTLSNALPPPGYNRSRPFVFALQEANGGVYLIQSTSHEQINAWVETCNYWAARQSKEPLQGGIGNLEYGWGDCLNDVILDLDSVEISGDYIHDPDAVNISVWTPPTPSMVPSILDEKTQLENMQKYVEQLNTEINEHREIKKKILVKFQYKSQNQTKALTNWEAKSTYMLHEIIKYQNYCNVLEKSINNNNNA